MIKIGFIISRKENECRRSITLEDLKKVKNKEYIMLEEGYFEPFQITDDDVRAEGFKVASYRDILNECECIVDPKIGDSTDLDSFTNKIIFGWIHATQNYNIVESMINASITGIAFEKMFENGIHSFYKNNVIAGKSAIFHSMTCFGQDYKGLKAAILGNGNTSRGAQDALTRLGAIIDVFDINQEEEFKSKFFNYDIVVNCILWDVTRKDSIIYKKDLSKMKKNSIIIDVSCDKAGGIETTVPTTVENPTYMVEGIMHYAVDHTPSFMYKEATASISNEVIKYIDRIIEEEDLKTIFGQALIMENGKIIDNEINVYQGRR